jgi:PKHD-type hydroxylase
MRILIGDILDREELARVRSALDSARFIDGRETAGWSARLVKNNQQVPAGDPALDGARHLIESKLANNAVFQLAARPKAMTPLLFARYGQGQSYGAHVDDAIMHGMRTDISFTLFLADPETYDGGELVMETTHGEEPVKGPAGSLFLYPSTTLHRVDPVSRGLRSVAVGWIESRIRSASRREILFDLDTARRSLFANAGKTAEFDLLSKSTANLLRMWAE